MFICKIFFIQNASLQCFLLQYFYYKFWDANFETPFTNYELFSKNVYLVLKMKRKIALNMKVSVVNWLEFPLSLVDFNILHREKIKING